MSALFLRGGAVLCLVCSVAGGQTAPATAASSKVSGGAPGAIQAPRFVEITHESKVVFRHQASPTSQKYLLETMGGGVAIFDFDNDGLPDLFFVNGAAIDDPMGKQALPRKKNPQFWNRLYRQNIDGTFTDVTRQAGVEGEGYGIGVAIGDYDNDGREDMLVTGYGHNTLYHNNGNGTFSDVTRQAGVGGSGWSTSAAWVDLDNDGKLDLVVARYLDWTFESNLYCGEKRKGYRAYCHPDVFKGISPLVYHNDGNGHFTEVAKQIGMGGAEGKGLGVAIADFNGDGLIDVFFANDSVRQFLYQNKGDGTFEEVGVNAGVSVNSDGKTFAGMGVDFADYNNDGRPDLVVTNLAGQATALYENAGDGAFTYATFHSGIGAMTLQHSGWGVRFFDYDNDGWKDLLIAQSHVLDTIQLTFPHLRYLESPLLARNTGKGFVDISESSGEVFHQQWASRGLAIGDLYNNGLLDAVITTNNGPAHILKNETHTLNHWILLNLVGTRSNRDGIGASVKITSSAGRSQFATVSTAGSYLSSGDKRVHFGLGAENVIQEIVIHWPSGTVQTLAKVKGDQLLTVREP